MEDSPFHQMKEDDRSPQRRGSTPLAAALLQGMVTPERRRRSRLRRRHAYGASSEMRAGCYEVRVLTDDSPNFFSSYEVYARL